MTLALVLIILALCLGFYVSWNIGANDVANAMGTSVGSGALTLKRAVIFAAVLEFCGAFFLGGNVSETVEGGIVNPEIFSNHPMTFVYGMLAVLLAAGVWLQVASYFGWPVSTTHSIVGAVVGFGVVLGGFDAIYWTELSSIVCSWIVSPILGGALAYFIFMFLRWKVFYRPYPLQAAKKITPYLVFLIFSLLPFIILFDGIESLSLKLSFFACLGLSIFIGLITAFISLFFIRRIKDEAYEKGIGFQNILVSYELKKTLRHLNRVEASSELGPLHDKVKLLRGEVQNLFDSLDEQKEYQSLDPQYRQVEKIFIFLQIITACFMAFAHGSNDVANAIGPLSAIFNHLTGTVVSLHKTVPPWMLALGGIGIVFGLATWGWRVIETVGRKITELTPTRGFAAEFGAATTIVLASKLGLPISTTHTLVGAVLGIGFARGIGAINLNTIREIFLAWIVTIPAAAVLAVIFFYVFQAIF